MDIRKNLLRIKAELPDHVTLVAVTKTKSVELIKQAYDAGHRQFGENKVQEMVEKQARLPDDVEWHMIGHVQRNKVKYMAPFVNLIHGVDSLKLLKEIDKQAQKHQRKIACLLQIKIASEESKFGISKADAHALLISDELATLKHIEIKGLMGMATFTDDENIIREEFKFLASCVEEFRSLERSNVTFDVLSMGMSGDYNIAIAHGSTMVRIGSSIFGSRS
ncbi:MAG: YggS family pyridoxal phosphate-dependent enzyme [Flavobacteriaceae bacterium]|nr:YggS family pyridoxal phosphate-dependent enzyme [Flavobacteriaceae bacterium]